MSDLFHISYNCTSLNDSSTCFTFHLCFFHIDLMKTAIPTEEQLAILSSHIGFSWEKLALLLHINSARIQQIKMDNPSSSEMCILRMLILWRREALSMQEHDRVETLTQALIKCELRNLAEKVARWKVEGQPLVLDD